MAVFENRLKRQVQAGKRTVGAWLQIASPITAEIMSRAGFDWLIVDLEHGPGDILTLVSQLQAMNGSGVTPLVRAPWNDFIMIKRILDAGAAGLLVPYVNTRAEAEAAVRACRYPPKGIRGIAASPRAAGFGQNPSDYLPYANSEIFIMTAVETSEAISHLDEILKADGVDGIFVGPMDLATSMGYFANPNHPEVVRAITEVERQVLGAKKTLATIASSWEKATELYARGYQMVVIMADGVSLAALAHQAVSNFRTLYPEG